MLREIESRTGLSERETYRSGLHVLFWLLQAGRLGETLEAAKSKP